MKKQGAFFNFEEIRAEWANEYVCWIDMMGTKNAYSLKDFSRIDFSDR